MADQALITYAARGGVTPDIRALLADDANQSRLFRRQNQILDAYAELERFRALGVNTPSAPPR